MRSQLPTAVIPALLCALGCATAAAASAGADATPVADYSYANTSQFRTTHLELSLEVDFESRELRGGVALEMQRLDPKATELVLDTKDLNILDVTELASDIVGGSSPEPLWINRPFRLGRPDPILGSALIIDLPASRQQKFVLRIDYVTTPQARGLHWTVPTVGNPHASPFLYTLSAPLNARSWIPLQDTLRARAPYSVHIHTADNLFAVMAAKSDNQSKHRLERWFLMDRPMPAASIALVAGDLHFKATGARSGLYTEKSASSAALKELGAAEQLLAAGEKLLGAYPLDRFDIVVIPESFPLPAVGNPDLAEISPTLMAADGSGQLPLAYALASAWTGALISPAEWRDRGLCEAIAGYLAHRLLAAVITAAPDAGEGGAGDEGIIAADLQGRAYDDMFNELPARKGNRFFSWLGTRIGSARVDGLLRTFLERYSGQSVSTAQFLAFLDETVVKQDPAPVSKAELAAWFYDAVVPADAAAPPALAADVAALVGADLKVQSGAMHRWTASHLRQVLDGVPDSIPGARLADLDREFKLSENPSAEIQASWFILTLRAGYPGALMALQKYLITTGELRLLEPLYEQLMQTEAGSALARRVYALARAGYHPFVARRLEELIKP